MNEGIQYQTVILGNSGGVSLTCLNGEAKLEGVRTIPLLLDVTILKPFL